MVSSWKALIRPQLEHASAIRVPCPKGNAHKPEMVQRGAARWTMSDDVKAAGVTVELQTLEEKRNVARLCLFYKIVYYMVSLRQYIQPIYRISRHCHSVTACQFHAGNDFYKNSFLPLDSVQKDALPASRIVP